MEAKAVKPPARQVLSSDALTVFGKSVGDWSRSPPCVCAAQDLMWVTCRDMARFVPIEARRPIKTTPFASDLCDVDHCWRVGVRIPACHMCVDLITSQCLSW
jgi:hypothetical protein